MLLFRVSHLETDVGLWLGYFQLSSRIDIKDRLIDNSPSTMNLVVGDVMVPISL